MCLFSHDWLYIPVNPGLLLQHIANIYPDKHSTFGKDLRSGIRTITEALGFHPDAHIDNYVTNKNSHAGMRIYYLFDEKNLTHMSPVDGNWFVKKEFYPVICRSCGAVKRNDIKLINHMIKCGNFIDNTSHPYVTEGFPWVDKILERINVRQIRYNFQEEFETRIEYLFGIDYCNRPKQINVD